MNIFNDKRFNSVALGHLYVDTVNGQRSVLLAYISGILGLSNSVLGLFSTLYVISASLVQPVFGYLADKVGSRNIVAGGVIWMATFFSLSILTRGYLSIVLLIIASIGSGVFHPAGTNQATIEGKRFLSGKETTALSIFVLFGGAGGFIGPLVSGGLLSSLGQTGLIILGIVGIPVGLYALKILPSNNKNNTIEGNTTVVEPHENRKKVAIYGLMIIAFIATIQAWTSNTLITFLPKYMSDLGVKASEYGLMVSLYAICTSVGNLVGGSIADHIGKHKVIITCMLLSIAPMYLIASIGYSDWFYLFIPLAGLFIGGGYSSIVILAQDAVPTSPGFATGIVLSFIFTSGALGTMVSGFVADSYGYAQMFYLCAGLSLLAGILPLLFRENKKGAKFSTRSFIK